MWHWFRTHPMVLVLLPLVVVLVLCNLYAWPINLLQQTEADYIDSVGIYQAVVRDYPTEHPKSRRLTVDLLQQLAPQHRQTSGTVYLYFIKDSVGSCPTYGDTIWVKTSVHRGQQIGGFDYGHYLRLSGVVGIGYVQVGTWRVQSSLRQRPLFSPKEWQHGLEERYRQMGIQGEELATLSALTLGQKELLADTQKQAFQRSGAAHVLAVSGLHTGIIYAVLLWLISLAGRWRPLYTQRVARWTISLVVVIALWLYAALTGFTPSVVRSVVMLSLVEWCRLSYRLRMSLNIVAAAAVLILLARPTDLFSVSFQMSFAAVVAIIVLLPHLDIYFHTPTLGLRLGKRLLIYVRDLLLVSLSAQLGTLPIALYYFGQCSNYFLLTNLMVLPLTWLIVLSALVLLLLGSIPYVGWLLAHITNGLTWLLNHSVQWVEHLPGAVTEKYINGWQVALLYGIIAVGFVLYKRWSKRYEQLYIKRVK